MAERKPFLLRLPPELTEELNRWAADDLRSLNAQIEYLLREAVRRRRRNLEDAAEESVRIEASGVSEDKRESAPPQA